ncbi:DUF3102 domain-containing protein [Leptospira gomenensis]|uniref:DUF3102 domain-containing protein n=1 Tax=Leptospira gomenensis TaxID=2484974 RepID=A0A5F1YDK4_9LEPT|nr:DUF3102 domain-containing protein [Leptospira gomenensis]TGK36207.1 DUF3102 domain-containing protein [Leptospira gomenensis]TGK42755.1 DUF3102 domain-containing protein [Leptospira gomenensis]TGK42942.1 DUF3102 domain-containing protein [Leptospira gomenensis]TGK54954.1 DUF3102 domain-containing protein [Leptospira gomenensis]
MSRKKQSDRVEEAMLRSHAGADDSLEVYNGQETSLVTQDPIARKIFSLLEAADNQAKTQMKTYIALGKVLIEHKALVGHGKFQKWFEKNVGPESGNPRSFSYMMGTRYMEIAENEEEVLKMEQISLRKALVHLKEKKAVARKEKSLNEDSPKARKLRAESLRSRKHSGETISDEESKFVYQYLLEIKKEKETEFTVFIKNLDDEISFFS